MIASLRPTRLTERGEEDLLVVQRQEPNIVGTADETIEYEMLVLVGCPERPLTSKARRHAADPRGSITVLFLVGRFTVLSIESLEPRVNSTELSAGSRLEARTTNQLVRGLPTRNQRHQSLAKHDDAEPRRLATDGFVLFDQSPQRRSATMTHEARSTTRTTAPSAT